MKNKEIYFYVDALTSSGINYVNIFPTYMETEKALNNERPLIYTFSIAHLSFDLLDKGYDIYLCKGDNKLMLKPTENVETFGFKLYKRDNIFEMFKQGYFDDLLNKNNRTMNLENKELLLKDLLARLPYSLYIKDEYGDTISVSIQDVKLDNFIEGIQLGKYKPYLRPLSSMTNEEFEFFNSIGEEDKICEASYKKVDWLNANHFDYRGLIEKGLALKAPKDMYNE